MTTLRNKTLFITGASRGIGKAIALRAARDGANVVIAAKTAEPHQRLPGTIYSAALEIEEAGGRALPLMVDVRDADQVQEAVSQAVEHFGGIDILVNNASAIHLATIGHTAMKQFDLMMNINVRGSYLCAQACLPHLIKAPNPHILTLSPPIDLQRCWFADHAAYTTSKFAMSMLSFGLAAELREDGVAVNALWPRTIIATSALDIAAPGLKARARTPDIMAEAAWHVLTKPSREFSGNFLLDEQVLRAAGVHDFNAYKVSPGNESVQLDLFVNP